MRPGEKQIKAIDELAEILRTNNIRNFTIRRESNFFNQILIWTSPYTFLSAVCQFGSYGFQDGLIEVYNFIDEPTGYLSPAQASELLIKWLKGYTD